MLYSAIVRRNILQVFARINAKDYSPMLDGLAGDFVYIFHGEHALGGTRRTRGAMKLWWERVFRLLPDIQFSVQEIVVSGWPWNTLVASKSAVRGTLPDGSRYSNMAFQLMRIRWGKIVSVETMENLQLLEAALDVVRRMGIDEAGAEPIGDLPHNKFDS